MAVSGTAVSPGMREEGARGLLQIQTCSAGQGQGLGPCLLGALLRPTNLLHSPWWPHLARYVATVVGMGEVLLWAPFGVLISTPGIVS